MPASNSAKDTRIAEKAQIRVMETLSEQQQEDVADAVCRLLDLPLDGLEEDGFDISELLVIADILMFGQECELLARRLPDSALVDFLGECVRAWKAFFGGGRSYDELMALLRGRRYYDAVGLCKKSGLDAIVKGGARGEDMKSLVRNHYLDGYLDMCDFVKAHRAKHARTSG